LIVLAAFIRVNNPFTLVLIIGLLSWPGLLRAVRSQVLAIKQSDFVEAARVLDLGTGHIIFREILPNMMSYITINFILLVTAATGSARVVSIHALIPFRRFRSSAGPLSRLSVALPRCSIRACDSNMVFE